MKHAEELDAKLATFLQQHPQFEPSPTATSVRQATGLPEELTSSYFSDPKLHIFRTRVHFIGMQLHESIIRGLRTTLESLEAHLATTPPKSASLTSSSFAAIDKLIHQHAAIVQGKAAEILGSFAYAAGDVDERGCAVGGSGSVPTSATGASTGPSTPRSIYLTSASFVVAPMLTIPNEDGDEFDFGVGVGVDVGGDVSVCEGSFDNNDDTVIDGMMMEADDSGGEMKLRHSSPSNLRTIETYVHIMALQQCPVLEERTVEVARWAGQRLVEELRCS